MEFWKSLRKRETPYAMIVTAENRSAVEWRMFMGTYKGATDVITKHLWPVPAFYATRFLAPRGVTPEHGDNNRCPHDRPGILVFPERPVHSRPSRRLGHDFS